MDFKSSTGVIQGLLKAAHLAQTIARRQANELGCLFLLQGVVP
jgi:hypothetical protein